MPQPATDFGFPCGRPVIQAKEGARVSAAVAPSTTAFHELVTHLVLEYERAVARNSELRAENARLRSTGVPPWESSAVALLEEERRAELPGFPASLTGRPILASERGLGMERPGQELNLAFASCHVAVSLRDVHCQTDGLPMDEEAAEEEGFREASEPISAPGSEASEAYEVPASASSRDPPERTAQPRLRRADSTLSKQSTMSGRARRFSTNGRPMDPRLTTVHMFLADADSGRGAQRYKLLMQLLVMASVATPLLQMLEPPLLDGLGAAVVESSFDVIFTAELAARLVVSPAPKVFFASPLNLIDLSAAGSLALRAAVGFVLPAKPGSSAAGLVLLCAVPILRLLKLLRRWERFHLLTRAFADSVEALPVLLFPLLLMTLGFSALIYAVEPRNNITTMAEAVWLTIVTMTTVGYGDVTPASGPGSLVVGLLVLSSVMYMAMPLAIIGGSFTQVWQDRHSILLVHRTKQRLGEWGYTAGDIPALFQVFDRDCSGDLDLSEFRRMVRAMKLGFSDERILQLFGLFDADGSGQIDDKEFVRLVFPTQFVEIYGADDPENDTQLERL